MKINEILLIDPSCYISKADNLELLYYSNTIENLKKAAAYCEKFHSYFHYEESFFYTILSFQSTTLDEKIKFLDKAINLSPLNQYAKQIKYSQNYSKMTYSQIIKLRPYNQFYQYLNFATNNNSIDSSTKMPCSKNYWALYENFHNNRDTETLKIAIADLSTRHAAYHIEASKIYHSLFLVAQESGQSWIAIFANNKVKDLDFSAQNS